MTKPGRRQRGTMASRIPPSPAAGGQAPTDPAKATHLRLHPPASSLSPDTSCFPTILAARASLQQLLPGDGPGEDLSLQPQVVVDLEILRQLHALAQHALQAVVHRQEVRVAVRPVIAA